MRELLIQSSGWVFVITLGIVLILGPWAVLLAPVWTALVIALQKVRHY